MRMTKRSEIQLPAVLWEHELFDNPAVHQAPASSLCADVIDKWIRRIRHMPSTGDASAAEALERLNDHYRQTLEQVMRHSSGSDEMCMLIGLICSVRQLNQSDAVRSDIVKGIRLLGQLQKAGLVEKCGSMAINRSVVLHRMNDVLLMVMDRVVARDERMRRRYLSRIYRILEDALAFNGTANTTRLRPIWQAIADYWDGKKYCMRYLDVGCSVETGAFTVVDAKQTFQRCGIEARVYGLDVVEPDKALQRRLLAEHRVSVYSAQTITGKPPGEYDVILLANVHRHLTREDQRAMFSHLGEALCEGGSLWINWRFDDLHSPCIRLDRKNDALIQGAVFNAI